MFWEIFGPYLIIALFVCFCTNISFTEKWEDGLRTSNDWWEDVVYVSLFWPFILVNKLYNIWKKRVWK